MSAASVLPWILAFPLIGFLVNGLLYLVSHSKLGTRTSSLGAHGESSHPSAGPGHHPHPEETGGHGLTHSPAHGVGQGADEHARHEIPFAAAHSLIGPVACGLSCLAAFLAIFAWWR